MSNATRVPASLKKLSTHAFSTLLLNKCVPYYMSVKTASEPAVFKTSRNGTTGKILLDSCADNGDQGENTLNTLSHNGLGDLVILSTKEAKHQDGRFQLKKKFLNNLKRWKNWWERGEWLGSHTSALRWAVMESFVQALSMRTDISVLLKLLLHLVFTDTFGILPVDDLCVKKGEPVALPAEECLTFAKVLESLGPFNLQELSTLKLSFEDQAPLIIILKNSPELRKLYIFQTVSPRILKHLRKCCKKLEVLTISIMNCKALSTMDLYKSFFMGMDCELVIKHRQNPRSVILSFPELKSVDIQVPMSNQDYYLFITVLLFFYNNLQCGTALNKEGIPVVALKKGYKSLCNKDKECHPMFNLRSVRISPDGSPSSPLHITGDDVVQMFPKATSARLNLNYHQSHVQAIKAGEWAMNIFEKLEVKIMYVELLPLYSSLYDEYRYHDEYLPTFTIIGSLLETLTLDFVDHGGDPRPRDPTVLTDIIDLCTNLKNLTIKTKDPLHCQNLKIKETLQSLTVTSFRRSHIHAMLQELIFVSPNLTCLATDSCGRRNCTLWSQSSKLKNLRKLYLKGNVKYHERISTLISELSNLKCVKLYMNNEDVQYFQNLYQYTALDIVGIEPMHEWGPDDWKPNLNEELLL